MASVLIVDDERSIRLTLAAFLTTAGHSVQTAETAEAGLELVAATPFDVLITDVLLPRRSGVWLFEQVRQTSARMQIIVITGQPDLSSAAAAVRAGVHDYLAKPVTRDVIVAAVDAAATIKAREDHHAHLVEENNRYRRRLERLVRDRTRSLGETEAKYRTVVEHAFDGILIVQEDTVCYANPSICNMLGVAVCDVAGTLFSQFATAAVTVGSDVPAAEGSPRRSEQTMRRADGTMFVAELTTIAFTFGGRPADLIVIRDISDRKHAEEALTEREEVLGDAQRVAGIGTFLWSVPDGTIRWSASMHVIAGLEPPTGEPEPLEEKMRMVHPDDRERVEGEFAAMLAAARAWPIEFRIVRPDGGIRHLRSGARFVHGPDGRPIRCVGAHIDITAAVLDRRRYELVRELDPAGIFHLDPEGRIQQPNPAFCRMTGETVEALMGRRLANLIAAAPESAAAICDEILTTGGEAELPLRRRDGTATARRVRIMLCDNGNAVGVALPPKAS